LSKKNDSFMVYRWQINKNGCGLWIHFLRIEMSGWMQTGKLQLLSRAFTWGILSLHTIKSLTTHYIHIHSASCNQALSVSFDMLSQRCLEENHSILLQKWGVSFLPHWEMDTFWNLCSSSLSGVFLRAFNQSLFKNLLKWGFLRTLHIVLIVRLYDLHMLVRVTRASAKCACSIEDPTLESGV
jgi:hypothetical protein